MLVLDMYQEIAVAKGPEYDRLNQKMDRCQENIERKAPPILVAPWMHPINIKKSCVRNTTIIICNNTPI